MNKTKSILLITLLLSTIMVSIISYQRVISNYKFDNQYYNEWGLADKSSTLTAKRQHIESFIQKLEDGNNRGEFAGHDAMFLHTPSNNFRTNLTALKTLQERLIAVENMDPESFQYNTAIQQITQQEQGEAHDMINVIMGCYVLSEYPMTWDWVGGTLFFVSSLIFLFSLVLSIILRTEF